MIVNPYRYATGGGGTPPTFISATDGAVGSVANGDLVLLFLVGVGSDPAAPSGWTKAFSAVDANGYFNNVYSSIYSGSNAAANSTNFPVGLGYFFTEVWRGATAILQTGTLTQVAPSIGTINVVALGSTTGASSALLAWVTNRDPAGTESSSDGMTSRYAQAYTFFRGTGWSQGGVQSGTRTFTRSAVSQACAGLLLEIA